MGMFSVMKEAIRIASTGTDGVHLSFDIDSVDPKIAPGTGTPVQGGLSYREAHLAMEMLSESGILTSAEFVENNPRWTADRQRPGACRLNRLHAWREHLVMRPHA